MPWFKIDDSAHSHPKFIRAGNAALGLWLRCGAYSAQHLLEGRIPAAIVKSFGTPAQVKKLVAADLWHEAEHSCSRCPQPADGDYVIHDFFEGGRNSTRAQVEASRQNATDRQARARARAADKTAGSDSERNRGANGAQFDDERNSNAAQSDPHFLQSVAGQDGLSQRDAINGVTPSQAKPSLTTAGRQDGQPGSINGVRVPDWAQPLIDGLAQQGMSVSWARLGTMQWVAIQELINTRGVNTLVSIAASRWNRRDPIKFASLLLTIWLEHPMPSPGSQTSRPSPKPDPRSSWPAWCKDPDCDEVTRTRRVEDSNGIRSLVRCPQCHPIRKESAA